MRAKPPRQREAPKAYLYLRLSVDEEDGKSLSIEAQRYAAHQYAERNSIEIIGEFADSGVSGTLSKRPQFDRMIAEAIEPDTCGPRRSVRRADHYSRVEGSDREGHRTRHPAP